MPCPCHAKPQRGPCTKSKSYSHKEAYSDYSHKGGHKEAAEAERRTDTLRRTVAESPNQCLFPLGRIASPIQ